MWGCVSQNNSRLVCCFASHTLLPIFGNKRLDIFDHFVLFGKQFPFRIYLRYSFVEEKAIYAWVGRQEQFPLIYMGTYGYIYYILFL